MEKYKAQFFERFRSVNIVELTVDFARVCCRLCSSYACCVNIVLGTFFILENITYSEFCYTLCM